MLSDRLHFTRRKVVKKNVCVWEPVGIGVIFVLLEDYKFAKLFEILIYHWMSAAWQNKYEASMWAFRLVAFLVFCGKWVELV
jgi:hypothetical protein